jgi:uncharacterized protein
VLVLLPPSETKRVGGDGPPLRVEALSSPALAPMREALIDELVDLADDHPACRQALGISASQHAEIERNATLRSSATLPAIDRYTGVLYDALDIGSLRAASAARARGRLAVGSALLDCCAPTIRGPPTGSPRRRSCPADPRWQRAGARCSNPCWRRSR